jgi:hypothetical protein
LGSPHILAVVFGLVWRIGYGCGAGFWVVAAQAAASALLGPNWPSQAFFGPMWIPVGMSLQFRPTRVIDVIAVITAKGERTMNGIPAETANPQSVAPAEQPKLPQKPRAAAHRPNVALSKAKSGHNPSPAKKATKGATSPKKKATGAHQGSKTAQVLDLLKRSGGATLKELMKATGWQAHSVRGFLSGALGKKMRLRVTSTKAADQERLYSVKG